MYETIVMTCGISLLNSNNLFGFHGIEQAEFQETHITLNMQKAMDSYLKQSIALFDQIDEQPNRISAEFSMLYALQKQKKLKEGSKIVLIYTDTYGGHICKQLLTTIFEKKFKVNVQHLPVSIEIKSAKEINNQLPDYLSKLGHALIHSNPSTTCFAPIGGFKVMTSYGYIIGSFLHFPTAYLHEEHQILVEIPPIPIDIDDRFINDNTVLLRKCQKDYVGIDELSYNEQVIVKKYPSIFTIEDGFVSVSPFGQFLIEYKFQQSIPDIRYSEQVQKMKKDNKHQSDFVEQQVHVLLQKLKFGESDEHLYHERAFVDLDNQKVQFHLYKGQNQFRLTYRYDEAEDILYANYLWLDHDKYEKEASKGIGIYKEEKFDTKIGGN